MLTQSKLRFCSRWLSFYGRSRKACVTNIPFLPSATGQKSQLYSTDLLQPFAKNCSWCVSNFLYDIGNKEFSTGSTPLLYVGAKTVVNVTITTDMVKCFAQATGDWNPLHFDAGKSSGASEDFKREVENSGLRNRVPIVHGALLNGIVSGVISTHLPGPGTVVVSQVYKFAAPLPVGSQVAVEVEVVDLKRREVNVNYKIVSILGGTVVMDGTARLMVPRGRVQKVS